VDCGDRGLHLVRPDRPVRQGCGDQFHSLGDLRSVPQPPVLLPERHQLAGRARPGCSPGVVQEHEREQPGYLWFVRQQSVDEPGEANGLRAQIGAHDIVGSGCVPAFGEDQINDVQDCRQSIGQLVGLGHPERYSRSGDLAFGPQETLGHRRLGDQEGSSDLRRGQAADRAQGQRDLGLLGQRGMAAQEDETELVVVERPGAALFELGVQAVGPGRVDRLQPDGGQFPDRSLGLAAQPVQHPVARDRREPGARIVRGPVPAPAFPCREQCLAVSILSQLEVAAAGHQRAQDPPGLGPDDVLEVLGFHACPQADGANSETGRTSITPNFASGISAASSRARSRSAQSTR
jgi:hypothetical protein